CSATIALDSSTSAWPPLGVSFPTIIGAPVLRQCWRRRRGRRGAGSTELPTSIAPCATLLGQRWNRNPPRPGQLSRVVRAGPHNRSGDQPTKSAGLEPLVVPSGNTGGARRNSPHSVPRTRGAEKERAWTQGIPKGRRWRPFRTDWLIFICASM